MEDVFYCIALNNSFAVTNAKYKSLALAFEAAIHCIDSRDNTNVVHIMECRMVEERKPVYTIGGAMNINIPPGDIS